jgi:hypothetical protein
MTTLDRITAHFICEDGSDWDILSGPVKTTRAGIKGLGMPEPAYQTQTTALTHGQTTDSWKLEARPLFIPLRFRDADPRGIQREFFRAIQPGKLTRMEVGDGGGGVRSIELKFGDTGTRAQRIDPHIHTEAFGLTMIADDPWWTGNPKAEPLTIEADTTPFLGKNAGDPPLYFTRSSTESEAISIQNDGDVEAWPVWRIYGDGDGVTTFYGWVDGNVVAGNFQVPIDHVLTITTDPLDQAAILTGPTVTGSGNMGTGFTSIDFSPIEAGKTSRAYATIGGAGHVTLSVTPRYFMAY